MCKKLLFLISFVGIVSSAFATEWNVGSAYREKTIEAAYALASTGDIITVHADTAGGTALYTATGFKDNDSKHDITFRRYGNDNIRITTMFEMCYKTGWTIDGFNFSQIAGNVYGVSFTSRANFKFDKMWVKNCIFYNLNSTQISSAPNATGSAWNVTIENCTFLNQTVADGIRANNRNYDWTIKDCIFQGIKHWDDSTTGWGGTALSPSGGNDMYADYCTFYDNGNNLSSSGNPHYGTDCTTTMAVEFASLDPNSPYFGMLTWNNDAKILTGDSGGSYRGARPAPEPATVALLGLGGLALLRKKR
jgi:hypothetical protein